MPNSQETVFRAISAVTGGAYTPQQLASMSGPSPEEGAGFFSSWSDTDLDRLLDLLRDADSVTVLPVGSDVYGRIRRMSIGDLIWRPNGRDAAEDENACRVGQDALLAKDIVADGTPGDGRKRPGGRPFRGAP